MDTKNGFTMFSGGDGAGIAMKMLGVSHVGGIEWDDEIAAVARANGFDVTTADILQCNPAPYSDSNRSPIGTKYQQRSLGNRKRDKYSSA